MSETPWTADRMEMVGKGPGGRRPRPAFCRSASSAQPPLLCPSDGGGVSSQGSQETDKSSLWPTCFLVTETHQHFSSPTSKPGHYFCQLVIWHPKNAQTLIQRHTGIATGRPAHLHS